MIRMLLLALLISISLPASAQVYVGKARPTFDQVQSMIAAQVAGNGTGSTTPVVTKVNGIAPDAGGNAIVPIPDISNLATKQQVATSISAATAPLARAADIPALPDLSGYDTIAARQSAVAAVQALIPSISGLATTTSVDGKISAALAALPAPADLSAYALKTQLPNLAPYALISQLPAAYTDAQAVAALASSLSTKANIAAFNAYTPTSGISALAPVQSVNGQTGTVTGLATTAGQTAAIAAESTARTSAIAAAIAAYVPPVTSVNGATGAVIGLASSLTLTSAIAGEATARDTAIASAIVPFVKTINGIAPDSAKNVLIPTAPFAPGFTVASPGTVANLMANSACAAGILGYYAVVSDLYSGAASTNEVMRCSVTGSTYYWRPQRTDYAAAVSQTSGTLTVRCLISAPIMFLSNGLTLAGNMTIAMQTTGCWPGAQFSIANDFSTLGLNTITVTGLLGGLTKLLGLNSRTTYYFDGTAWRAF